MSEFIPRSSVLSSDLLAQKERTETLKSAQAETSSFVAKRKALGALTWIILHAVN